MSLKTHCLKGGESPYLFIFLLGKIGILIGKKTHWKIYILGLNIKKNIFLDFKCLLGLSVGGITKH